MTADALRVLREDHQRVQGLFREFERVEDREVKAQIVERAMMGLEVHTRLEQELLYPALRDAGDAGAIDIAEEEHHVAELLMEELAKVLPSDPRYEVKVKVLAESVGLHIAREEATLFARAAQLDGERLLGLGEQMATRREQLLAEVQDRASRV